MEVHVRIVGVLLIMLALMHVGLPRYFRWRHEAAFLSLVTKQILYVHTFFIGFVVLLMGVLCIGYTSALVHDAFGKVICSGLFIFWFTRLIFQFFVYSPALWRGKRFETVVHIVFSFLWIYFAAVFGWVSLQ